MKPGKYRVSFPLISYGKKIDWYKIIDGDKGCNIIGGVECLPFDIKPNDHAAKYFLHYTIPGVRIHDTVSLLFDGRYSGIVYFEGLPLVNFTLEPVEEEE
jgi:hypothetical protein